MIAEDQPPLSQLLNIPISFYFAAKGHGRLVALS